MVWHFRPVPFKFQLSDWVLFSVPLQLQVRVDKLVDETPPVEMPTPQADELLAESQGFMIRGLPVARTLPLISRVDGYLRYVPLQYHHCYIDFSMSFEDYQKKFSSKTRSTINRKIRKYSEHCNGIIPWKTYQSLDEMRDFFRLARKVSQLTYQERLLDAGIPDSDEFTHHAEMLAAEGRVRAYILFDGERPVSYLYCPIESGVLNYAYLGYDPDYMNMSVGTILQWLAVEQLFGEGVFRYFDFLEGQGDHKRLFATHQRQCANVFLVKETLRNTIIIYGQLLMGSFSKWLGAFFKRIGLKAKIKKYFRFGM